MTYPQIKCAMCGLPFERSSSTNVCSETCRKTRLKLLRRAHATPSKAEPLAVPSIRSAGAIARQGRVAFVEDLARANLLCILLDVKGDLLSASERGFISALTMREDQVDNEIKRLIERVA